MLSILLLQNSTSTTHHSYLILTSSPDVDEGSTVTDFLPAERARGITIQSAAITFHWPPAADSDGPPKSFAQSKEQHTINLIDTPGHADFTFEVVRSLRVLDGAICILDGVAGVEAQTEKVWRQANNYRIPRVIYINKLDRDGAAFNRTVNEIASKLHTWPVLCQIPWWKDGKFVGVLDAINLRGLYWEQGGDGSIFDVHDYQSLTALDSDLAEELKKARVALVEILTEHDDKMVEEYIDADEDFMAIAPAVIIESLRKSLLSAENKITPVFAGASFRNTGVQPLLDAVNDFFPSPKETADPEIRLGEGRSSLAKLLHGELMAVDAQATKSKSKKAPIPSTAKTASMVQNLQACALAFKVVNDPRRGVLVYVRVYSGSIARNALLYNTNLALSERAPRLLRMYANDAVEIQSIDEGQIGVIAGLKHARTGDTLIVYAGSNPKTGPPAPLNTLQLRPIDVPPPLFFTSLEPASLAEEKNLNEHVALLLREDPSLTVSIDPESGQTQLAGMGELHLEIARDRLINDFKVRATTGAIEIGYREAILDASGAPITETFDREVAGRRAAASCTASVAPIEDGTDHEIAEDDEYLHSVLLSDSTNRLTVHTPTLLPSGLPASSEHPSLPLDLPLAVCIAALSSGTSAALARGPSHALPMHSAHVHITLDPATHLTTSSTAAALSSAARTAVTSALRIAAKNRETVLMEPVMLASIAVTEDSLGAVVHDLSSARGAQVLSLDGGEDGDSASSEEHIGFSSAALARVYAPPDPFGDRDAGGGDGAARGQGQQRLVKARVPLKEMVGYLKNLRSLTGGRGTFVMSVDRFERMNGQRMKAVLQEMKGGYV